MAIKPILFNTEMVRAILEDRKTVTRRAIKDKDIINGWDCESDGTPIAFIDQETEDHYPPTHPCSYRPGDILYVRETWCNPSGTGYPFLYKADMPMHWDAKDTEIGVPVDLKSEDYTWRPSIHMPREAARLFLRVTDVRVERLWDLTEEQAEAEGVTEYPFIAIEAFRKLWDSTIKPTDRAIYGWGANPWVWAIKFERIAKEDM